MSTTFRQKRRELPSDVLDILVAMSFSDLQAAVQAIQSWLDDPPGEAVVRQCIVLRLLLAGGFDIWNPGEVVPEETNAGGRRSDFLVRRGQGRFALEIKGMGISLGSREYEQAVTYSVHEGSRWAIVTNGRKWVVLDEHLPGKYEERAALTLEMGQETDAFAQDLYSILNAETWEKDALAEAMATVKARQQQRKDEARIRREKWPIVEELRKFYGMSSFELAADAARRMGQITEEEQGVLLNRAIENPSVSEEITFTYAVGQAKATAIYRPSDGTWTVKAGSTARNVIQGHGSVAPALAHRRQKMLNEGNISALNDQLLQFDKDVWYSSPSTAAVDIAGGSRNGWVEWKDAQNRPAQYYRPTEN